MKGWRLQRPMDPHAYGVIFELYKTDIVGMLLVCLDDSMNPFHAYSRVAYFSISHEAMYLWSPHT